MKRDFEAQLEDEKQAIQIHVEEITSKLKKFQLKNEKLQSQMKKDKQMHTKE